MIFLKKKILKILLEKTYKKNYKNETKGIRENKRIQRRAVASRRAMIFLKNQRLQNRIDLHLALGGDFKTSPPD